MSVSLVASKDGYADLNPDETLDSETGFADLAAGLKYAFILDPVEQLAVSETAVIELPTGDEEIFQGNGDGGIDLTVSALGLRYQLFSCADFGVAYELPLTDEESNLMDDRITVDLVLTF